MFHSLAFVLMLFCATGVHASSLPGDFVLESPKQDGSLALSMSFLQGSWDGNSLSEVPGIGYGGNANFDVSSAYVSTSVLKIYFQTPYQKEPAFCSWKFVGASVTTTRYYLELNYVNDYVFAFLFDPLDNSHVHWSTISTEFSIICFGASPISVSSSDSKGAGSDDP